MGGLEKKLQTLQNTHGKKAAVSGELQKLKSELLPNTKNQLTAINSRAGVIRETLKFLETPEGERIKKCPVCKQVVNVTHVRQHLKEWQQQMTTMLAPIEDKISELETKKEILEQAINQFNQLELNTQTKREDLLEVTLAIGKALNREISDTEDPVVLINQEIEKISGDLDAIRTVVEQSNSRLNEIEDGLEEIRCIATVLSLQKNLEELSKLKDTSEYKLVERARKNAYAFGDEVSTICEAIEAVLWTTAQVKIESTKAAISNIYQKLNPRSGDFSDIEIDPEKYEVMAVGPKGSEVALRILNKGPAVQGRGKETLGLFAEGGGCDCGCDAGLIGNRVVCS